jgi:hypothetical protein
VSPAFARADDYKRTLSLMQLRLLDPVYTDQLAAYLRSVGQHPVVGGPGSVEVDAERAEVEVYLRVWAVLHPDAEVEILH